MLKRRCIGLNRPIQPRKVPMPMRVPMHRGIPSFDKKRLYLLSRGFALFHFWGKTETTRNGTPKNENGSPFRFRF